MGVNLRLVWQMMKPQPPTDTFIFIARENFVSNDCLMAGIFRGVHMSILRYLFINAKNFRREIDQYHVLVR